MTGTRTVDRDPGLEHVVELEQENRQLRERVARLSAELARARDKGAPATTDKALHQSQKFELIARLVNGIAHDFNNVLAVASANASMIADDDIGPEDHRECVDNILLAGERGSMLVQKLTTFARQQEIKPKLLQLGSAVDSVERFLRLLAGSGMAFRTEYDPEPGNVRVDANQLEQVLMNLVVNARDACRETGVVTIRTSQLHTTRALVRGGAELPAGSYGVVSVSDDGPGIADEVLPHVFEPFFTTKAPGQGTGLGLATVHALVTQNHGHVAVTTSERGTNFEIFLPLVQERLRERVRTGPPMPHTVLLVEDDDVLREALTSVLQRRGFTVVAAADGHEALAIIDAGADGVDLLLTDVMLPGPRGTDLARRFRERFPERPALLMTGYAPEAGGWSSDLAGVDVLTKPVMPARLVQAIRDRLALRVVA